MNRSRTRLIWRATSALFVLVLLALGMTTRAEANQGIPQCFLSAGGSVSRSGGILLNGTGVGQVDCNGPVSVILYVEVYKGNTGGAVIASEGRGCYGVFLCQQGAPFNDADTGFASCYVTKATAVYGSGTGNTIAYSGSYCA